MLSCDVPYPKDGAGWEPLADVSIDEAVLNQVDALKPDFA
jgi:hypothetical protein